MNPDVQAAVAAWLPSFRLPDPDPASPRDLAGRTVRIARLSDDEAVRFFFPRRTLIFQQRMVKHLAAQLRKRGAALDRIDLTPEDYARWMQAQGETDSPELRFRFATLPPIGE